MKTRAAVMEWCAGAIEELGDPSLPVCQLFFRWENNLATYAGDDIVCGIDDGGVVLVIGGDFPRFPVPLELGPARLGPGGEIAAFGAQRITDGVWAMFPSLNAVGLIHGFCVLYGVPDPAPWERRIVIP